MKYLAFLTVFLLACSDDPEPQPAPTVVVQTTIPIPRPAQPQPHVRECTVTKMTAIKDCTLYDLLCDDGETDMVLLCPIQYWEPGEYVPTPP